MLESSEKGVDRVLLYITAAGDAGLDEIDNITSALAERVSPDANIILGMHFDESMEDQMKIVLIATKEK